MKLCCISDTHCQLSTVREKILNVDADLLAFCGDMTYSGSLQEVIKEMRILGELSYRFKQGVIVIPGNHDRLSESEPSLFASIAQENGLIYMHEKSVTIGGLHFYGSGWTPEFCNWAWGYPRELGQQIWENIPDDTEVLLTHGPYKGILDNGGLGCYDLRQRVGHLPKLRLHVFGHMHSSYGEVVQAGVRFVNASICNERYEPVNSPVVIEI